MESALINTNIIDSCDTLDFAASKTFLSEDVYSMQDIKRNEEKWNMTYIILRTVEKLAVAELIKTAWKTEEKNTIEFALNYIAKKIESSEFKERHFYTIQSLMTSSNELAYNLAKKVVLEKLSQKQ